MVKNSGERMPKLSDRTKSDFLSDEDGGARGKRNEALDGERQRTDSSEGSRTAHACARATEGVRKQ